MSQTFLTIEFKILFSLYICAIISLKGGESKVISTSFKHFSANFGHEFSIQRDSKIIYKTIGVENTEKTSNKCYVGFSPNTDIQVGDVIINSMSALQKCPPIFGPYLKTYQLVFLRFQSNCNTVV